MTKRLCKISAIVFAGVFVFALAFTLTASSAYATNCCEVWNGEDLYLSGVWTTGSTQDPPRCTCAPLMPGGNPDNCRLLCPEPE